MSGSINTSGSTTMTYDTLLFYIDPLAPGETGHITIQGDVKTVFGSSDITHSARISSLVPDPNPLNNNASASTLIVDQLTEFG